METTRIEKLKGLTDEDCWSIIKQKAFREGCVIAPDFEDIGKKIATKCQGLPLAAKVVGGVLRGKPIAEWRSIERDELLDLGDEGNIMKKILKLSFHNLPHQSLKKCFAYFAIFPKGYQMEKSMLIHLWMVEGFLQSDDMEVLGDKYFGILLHNSLLQVGEQLTDGSIEYYTMHDLVYDLAFSILNESGRVRCIYLESITHLPKGKARDVRSLIFEGGISDDNMLSDFKYLRSLVLIPYFNTRLPKIEHLIYLRHLDILCTSFRCSPELFGNLYLLETFRAKVTSNEFPEALTKLINLRHVYVEGTEEPTHGTLPGREVVASPCLETSATSCFPNLKTLCIRQMRSRSLLESLLVSITSLAELQFEHLRGLVCLPEMFFHNNQNLMCLKIKEWCDWNYLTRLPPCFGESLRQVKILHCSKLEGLLEIPQFLESLELYGCWNIKSIPYNPSCGCPSLRELKIDRCDGLTELPIGVLESCSLSLESVLLDDLESLTNMGMVIACLQKMPRLTSLSVDLKNLANVDFPIENVVGSFNSLHDLDIRCGMEIWQRLEEIVQNLNALRKLTLWGIEMEAMPEWLVKLPSLRELELNWFKELRSLPSKEALKHLTRLEVYECPRLNLRRDDDNSEWHKVSHIPDLDLKRLHNYQVLKRLHNYQDSSEE